MSYIATIIFYNLILVISLYFSKTYLYKTKGQAIISFLIVFLMSALRFDIGNDYQLQAEVWDAISQLFISGFSLKDLIILKGEEPFGLFLCWLFKNSQHPSAYVFFIYALIFTTFIFKAFKDNNECFTSGIFALFTMLFLFFSWDWTRQGVAYAIGLYSLKYVRLGSLGKFIICVLTASLFHVSAIMLLPLYFFRWFNIKKEMAILIILLFTIMAYLGIFDKLFSRIINAVGLLFYGNYSGSKYSTQFKETSASILVLFHSFITILIIYFIPEKEKLLRNAITIGSVIFIISSQNLLLERVSYYYYIFIILAFQYLDQLKCSKYKLNRIAYYMLFFIMILYYNYAIINIGGTRGAVPYDSILLENFDTGNYRYRKFLQF